MAKRGATSDLNHENWNNEDPPESAGVFKKASAEIMGKRIIKTAKRKSEGITDGNAKNVFAQFQGFKSVTAKPNTDLQSTFSFLKNTTSTNGSSNLNTGVSSSTSLSNSKETTKPVEVNKINNSHNENSRINNEIYPHKLVKLNQSVASWISSHVAKDPTCILTPVFSDYQRYLKEIEAEDIKLSSGLKQKNNSNLLENISASGMKLPTSLAESGFKSSSSPSCSVFSGFKTENSSSGGTVLFKKPDPASLMVNPFTSIKNQPESNNEKNTTFKFNQGNSPVSSGSSTSTSGFSFTAGKLSAFSSSDSVSAVASKNVNNDDDNVEDSDEPPKVEYTPIKEDDAIYNKKCKVFIKKDSGYADLGVGTLYIKDVGGEKHQLLVRANTTLGNILVNVLLTSSIPTQRMGKNNVMIICVPVPPPAGQQAIPSTVLIRVKTAEEADDLLKELEKYKKS